MGGGCRWPPSGYPPGAGAAPRWRGRRRGGHRRQQSRLCRGRSRCRRRGRWSPPRTWRGRERLAFRGTWGKSWGKGGKTALKAGWGRGLRRATASGLGCWKGGSPWGCAAPQNPPWAVPRGGRCVRPWRGDAGGGVTLILHGCCSTLMLLLHPLVVPEAGAKAPCPRLPIGSVPRGAPVSLSLAGAPRGGREKTGDALSSGPVSAAPWLLCPHILSQKWEKNSPSQGVLPSAGGRTPESGGKQAKTSQEPKKKKKKKPKSWGFLEEHDPLWPQPSSHRLHGSPRLQDRAGVGTPTPCHAN